MHLSIICVYDTLCYHLLDSDANLVTTSHAVRKDYQQFIKSIICLVRIYTMHPEQEISKKEKIYVNIYLMWLDPILLGTEDITIYQTCLTPWNGQIEKETYVLRIEQPEK